jgi:hypothetical protein
MTFEELKKIMAKFTYKPGSRFQVRRGPERGLYFIEVSIYCQDVNAPHKLNFVTNQTPVFEVDLMDWTDALVIARVQNAVQSIEQHEIQEWLRLDGMFVSDPHPEIRHGNNYPRET